MKRQEILEALWKEITLRQEHYWGSFNRFGLVIITVSVAPYLRPEIVGLLDKLIVVFPIASLILSLICTWYLGAEYQRLRMVRHKYDELLAKDCKIPRMPLTNWWEKLVAKRIGSATSIIFGICFVVLSIVNAAILWFYPLKNLTQLSGH